MKANIRSILFFLLFFLISMNCMAQDVDRVLPAEWENLVYGGQFSDLFLPMPLIGELSSDTWGSQDVLPRDTLNGIENPKWSYWGGRPFIAEDGKYNMFICRWAEDHPEGHWAYHYSEIVRSVSDNPLGPYIAAEEIVGLGHNPDLIQLKNGRYMIYTVGEGHVVFYYISNSLDGPWQEGDFVFDLRDRKKLRTMVNMTFVVREDGSVITMPRAGDMWISETGTSPYYRISNKSTHPPMEGKYEDPVIWKDHIQYHKIVNDWYGRIAHYQRSKDGIHWTNEPGLAYYPGISVYEDGSQTNWYKYERIRMLQDEYGRAIQANFAVIDTSKHADITNDNHNSKNISIPLSKGRLLEVLNKERIHQGTKQIKLLIKAEADINPHKDIDLESLRLGSAETINFGGGSKVKSSKKKGKNLIITFNGDGNGLTEENFALKLLGKTTGGELLFGWARLPGVKYNAAILSSRKPHIKEDDSTKLYLEVQNFGLSTSEPEELIVQIHANAEEYMLKGRVPALAPYEKTMLGIENTAGLNRQTKGEVKVYLKGEALNPVYEQSTDLISRPEDNIIEKAKGELKQYLVPGQINSRETKGKHALGYHVYLPTNYNAKNPPPIVIAFSPGGNGRGILKKIQDAAEEAGWIAIGCDSLRNRMKDQELAEEFEDELLDEIFQTIVHDKDRRYLSGFSGGGMRAYSITARRKEKYAGVIAYGGWLGGFSYQNKPYQQGMSVAIINGIKDKGANHWNAIDSATLDKKGCSVMQFSHGGGHKVAPPDVTLEAIKWLNEEWERNKTPDWIIDSQQDWLSTKASASNILVEEDLARSTHPVSTFKSVVKQYKSKRSAQSITFKQADDWNNWKQIPKVGVPGMDDAPVFISPGDDEYYILARLWPTEFGKKQWDENGDIVNDPRPESEMGYHAWYSTDMIEWEHCGPISGYRERWVTTAEYKEGKFYIYYDHPNDEDPHLIIDDNLRDGIMGEDIGMVFEDPSHGSDCAVLRDEDDTWHLIYENWDPINAKTHAWDSPLAGHAVSPFAEKGYKIIDHAVDHRTRPTGQMGEYIHGTTKEIYKYEIHEPGQNAYGDWTAIKVGGQYYLFCDYDPAGDKIRIGRFTSNLLYSEFSFCGALGQGHPDPTIGFAEGQFYLIQQRADHDYLSPGPWINGVEARVGVDISNNGEIDAWTPWQMVKETYSLKPGFARVIDSDPASIDLSSLPAGYGFCFEYKTSKVPDCESLIDMSNVTLRFSK